MSGAAGGERQTRRRTPFVMRRKARWAYLAPALSGFLFVGHAYEDAGPVAAAPYALVLLLSLVSLVRPTQVAWLVLAILDGAYMVLLVAAVMEVQFGDWILFFLLGAIPTAAL